MFLHQTETTTGNSLQGITVRLSSYTSRVSLYLQVELDSLVTQEELMFLHQTLRITQEESDSVRLYELHKKN